MIVSKDSLLLAVLAVQNVALWGDTDILPFPLENHWFHDAENEVVSVLSEMDAAFEKWSSDYPLSFDKAFSAVGYFGFRGATQIDPIWNAYLLGLVVQLGHDIEKQRLSIEDNRIFSYRFAPDLSNKTLFDRAIGWNAFQSYALSLSALFQVLRPMIVARKHPGLSSDPEPTGPKIRKRGTRDWQVVSISQGKASSLAEGVTVEEAEDGSNLHGRLSDARISVPFKRARLPYTDVLC